MPFSQFNQGTLPCSHFGAAAFEVSFILPWAFPCAVPSRTSACLYLFLTLRFQTHLTLSKHIKRHVIQGVAREAGVCFYTRQTVGCQFFLIKENFLSPIWITLQHSRARSLSIENMLLFPAGCLKHLLKLQQCQWKYLITLPVMGRKTHISKIFVPPSPPWWRRMNAWKCPISFCYTCPLDYNTWQFIL